jgi:3-isopropylmalate/(R)-2-methylmalate dehydratase small subunit
METITEIRSRTVVIPAENVDTDQIIPARFLTTTSREGLGAHAFADWRFDEAGRPRADCVFNEPLTEGCEVLVAGRNFGCGSSREHAPWALLDYGFRAVVSSEIADIFRSNALKNGLVPVQVDDESHAWLLAHPGADVTIDIVTGYIEFGDEVRASFPLDRFARHCLLNGVDSLGFLLDQQDAIRRYEDARTCMSV